MAPRPSGPHLAQRFRTLALTQPPNSALFYAYNYRAFFPPTELEHDSVHVLALCHLAVGNTYSALGLVREFADADADPSHDIPDYENGIPARRPGCYGCAVIVAKCCAKLGRFSEGQAVLDRAIRRSVPLSEYHVDRRTDRALTLSTPDPQCRRDGGNSITAGRSAVAQGQSSSPGYRVLHQGADR